MKKVDILSIIRIQREYSGIIELYDIDSFVVMNGLSPRLELLLNFKVDKMNYWCTIELLFEESFYNQNIDIKEEFIRLKLKKI